MCYVTSDIRRFRILLSGARSRRRRRQAAFVFITEGSGNSPRNHEI